jgi:transposase
VDVAVLDNVVLEQMRQQADEQLRQKLFEQGMAYHASQQATQSTKRWHESEQKAHARLTFNQKVKGLELDNEKLKRTVVNQQDMIEKYLKAQRSGGMAFRNGGSQ